MFALSIILSLLLVAAAGVLVGWWLRGNSDADRLRRTTRALDKTTDQLKAAVDKNNPISGQPPG